MQFLSEKPAIFTDISTGTKIPVPALTDIEAIEKLLKGLDWIYQDFMEDCSRNPNLSKAALDEGFCIRNLTRTLNYANHASLVEGLIKKTYSKTAGFLNEKVSKDIPDDTDVVIKAQSPGFKRTSEFRHTVSAHLSYINPKSHSGEDSVSTQLTSLMALLAPPAFNGKDTSTFTIAAFRAVMEDEDGTREIREIPAFSISTTHKFLWGVHYPKWGQTFDELIRKTNTYLENGDKKS